MHDVDIYLSAPKQRSAATTHKRTTNNNTNNQQPTTTRPTDGRASIEKVFIIEE